MADLAGLRGCEQSHERDIRGRAADWRRSASLDEVASFGTLRTQVTLALVSE